MKTLLVVICGRAAAVLVVVALLGTLLAPVAGAWAPPSTVEALLAEDAFARINDERVARGLHTLRWDPGLAHAAADWSQHMGSTGDLAHRRLGDLRAAPWNLDYQALAENIAWGPAGVSSGRIHSLFMDSAGHRRNLLDPGFDAVGRGLCG